MTTTRILMVEDDDDDYILTLDYLEELTFLDLDLVRVISADEALSQLKQNTFDLCLLDYQLGAVNGLEVLRQAQALGFSGPIIMLTGQQDDSLDQSALNAGAADYLIKSELNASRFARAIRYALARRDVEVERVERLKAEAENRSKNRFLAHLSHELRTPLTAILGYTELLLNSRQADNVHYELEVIMRNGRHLLNLLNDVLDLSKIAANKLELNLTEVNVESLVADVYSLLNVSAVDKGLELRLTSATPIPSRIITDATRIRQILINIINNAIKFTDEGHINICLSMAHHGDKECFIVEVSDTGIGIAHEKLDNIFQPFSQLGDVVSKRVGGSGLGLSISFELAQRLGGTISVLSEAGEGSCFTLSVDPGNTEGIPRDFLTFQAHEHLIRSAPVTRLQGRVLVVDDLRDIRRLIGHLVQSTGAETVYAANGISALSAVEDAKSTALPVDLILMDIHMPEMDGKAATRALRARGVDIPIIALTAATMRGSEEKLKECGFNDILNKPVDTQALVDMLKNHLALETIDSGEIDNRETNGNAIEASATQSSTNTTGESTTPSSMVDILLVEDDEDVSSVLCLLLKQLHTHVTSVHTAKAAYDLIDAQHWDAVLLDLNLPDASGIDVARHIRSTTKASHGKTYIALISGESPDPTAIAPLRINHSLLKPILLSSLKVLVNDIHEFLRQQ